MKIVATLKLTINKALRLSADEVTVAYIHPTQQPPYHAEWQHWDVAGRRSPVTVALIRWPNWYTKSVASAPNAPNSSTATEIKQYVEDKLLHFTKLSLLGFADHDARNSQMQVAWRQCVWTSKVPCQSPTVWPRDSDNSSSRLLSSRKSVDGSWRQGISADAGARLMSSLTALWRNIRPADLRQLSPWLHVLSTAAPRTQTSGAQTGAPRRDATAIRRDELSSRVPRAERGRAWRKAPEWGVAAAASRIFTVDWSQPTCAVKYEGWTGSESTRVHHSATAAFNNGTLMSSVMISHSWTLTIRQSQTVADSPGAEVFVDVCQQLFLCVFTYLYNHCSLPVSRWVKGDTRYIYL